MRSCLIAVIVTIGINKMKRGFRESLDCLISLERKELIFFKQRCQKAFSHLTLFAPFFISFF